VFRSVDLQKLLKKNKLILVESSQEVNVKKESPKIEKNISSKEEGKVLAELRKDLIEIKDLIRNGIISTPAILNEKDEYNEETKKQITALQVRNLSETDGKVEKNFDNIGHSIEKTENVDKLSDILDSLGE
jgi:hypothetical protein